MDKFKIGDNVMTWKWFYNNIRYLEQQTGILPQHKNDIKEHFKREAKAETYINDTYQVKVYKELYQMPYADYKKFSDKVGNSIIWLSIKRHDKEPIHDWRHMMEIKNQIVGEEFEAVELYPKKSRMVDTANQYHLWVMKHGMFPFGFITGVVYEENTKKSKQRSF